MTKRGPSLFKLTVLFLLLIMLVGSAWLLSTSNLATSPSIVVADLDASLKASFRRTENFFKNLLNKNNAELGSKNNIQTPTLYGVSTPPATPNNLQEIMSAIDTLNRQVQEGKNDPSYHNRLGILYAQMGDFNDAIKHLDQAVFLCRQQLASLHAKTKEDSNLKKVSLNKSALADDNSSIYIQLNCAHSNLARIYDRLGDHNRVFAELDELNRDIVFAGDIPNSAGKSKKNLNKYTTTTINNKSTRLTAEEAAILARAEALRQVGRLPEAVQEYVKLIQLNPNIAIAHQRLGLAAVSDSNFWLSINELQLAAQLDKGDPDTQNDLGLVYQQIGDFKSAKQAFANACKIDPKHLSATVNLANCIADSGDYKSAISLMQKATKYYPDSPMAHNNLASLIARTNNQTEAAKEFAKAINLNPNLASAHYGLGIALLKLKSYVPAEKEFQAAFTLNPGILDLQNKIDLANRCNLRTLAYTQSSFK